MKQSSNKSMAKVVDKRITFLPLQCTPRGVSKMQQFLRIPRPCWGCNTYPAPNKIGIRGECCRLKPLAGIRDNLDLTKTLSRTQWNAYLNCPGHQGEVHWLREESALLVCTDSSGPCWHAWE